MNDIDSMRASAARIAKRGIGMPMAGTLYWIAAAVIGAHFPPANAATLWFFCTGLVFPIGLGFTRLFGGDLFAKGHPLKGLGGLLNLVQAFYWPVLIVVYFRDPTLVPFTIGVLFCSHFLPYGWYYRSAGYTLLGIAAPIAAIVVQIVAREHVFVWIPAAIAAVHAVAVAMLWREVRRDALEPMAAPAV